MITRESRADQLEGVCRFEHQGASLHDWLQSLLRQLHHELEGIKLTAGCIIQRLHREDSVCKRKDQVQTFCCAELRYVICPQLCHPMPCCIGAVDPALDC